MTELIQLSLAQWYALRSYQDFLYQEEERIFTLLHRCRQLENRFSIGRELRRTLREMLLASENRQALFGERRGDASVAVVVIAHHSQRLSEELPSPHVLDDDLQVGELLGDSVK